jgi:hypothetical protein
LLDKSLFGAIILSLGEETGAKEAALNPATNTWLWDHPGRGIGSRPYMMWFGDR